MKKNSVSLKEVLTLAACVFLRARIRNLVAIVHVCVVDAHHDAMPCRR